MDEQPPLAPQEFVFRTSEGSTKSTANPKIKNENAYLVLIAWPTKPPEFIGLFDTIADSLAV